ncbi:hypothetical protein AWENTII_003854 [Aspergillus wentii]
MPSPGDLTTGYGQQSPTPLAPDQIMQREKKQNALRASIADLQSQVEQIETQIAETKTRLQYAFESDLVETFLMIYVIGMILLRP